MSDQEMAIDMTNRQMVGLQGDGSVAVLLPKQRMTREEALLHAAWIVAICAPEHNEFERVLTAVMNT